MFCRTRSKSLGIFLAGALVAGCTGHSSDGPAVRDQMAASAVRTPPSSQPAAPGSSAKATVRGRPIATVNGEAIDRSELVELLIKSKGLGILQQLVLIRVVQQEAARRGLTCSEADVALEYERTIEADHFNGKDPAQLTDARREQIIAEWTRTRGVSREELDIAIRRQALLRKMVADQIRVDEDMLRKEFARVHGEKAEVRHLQLAAPRYFAEIKKRLDAGERFEDLVMTFSQNIVSREKGGLLPPFSATDTTVPPAFSKVAFALEPGQVSGLFETEGNYHVIKLERRLPADDVTFDQVRDNLRKRVASRLTVQAMEQLGGDLLLRSDLRIAEPHLLQQYETGRGRGEITGPAASAP